MVRARGGPRDDFGDPISITFAEPEGMRLRNLRLRSSSRTEQKGATSKVELLGLRRRALLFTTITLRLPDQDPTDTGTVPRSSANTSNSHGHALDVLTFRPGWRMLLAGCDHDSGRSHEMLRESRSLFVFSPWPCVARSGPVDRDQRRESAESAEKCAECRESSVDCALWCAPGQPVCSDA